MCRLVRAYKRMAALANGENGSIGMNRPSICLPRIADLIGLKVWRIGAVYMCFFRFTIFLDFSGARFRKPARDAGSGFFKSIYF